MKTDYSVFIFKDLATCTHVLVSTDAHRSALQKPYEGPYQVIKRDNKYFTILIKGRKSNISFNQLKPCFVETDNREKDITSTKTVITDLQPELPTKNDTQKSVNFNLTDSHQITTRLDRTIRPAVRYK